MRYTMRYTMRYLCTSGKTEFALLTVGVWRSDKKVELLELNESEVGQWREIEDYPFVKVLTTRKISYFYR